MEICTLPPDSPPLGCPPLQQHPFYGQVLTALGAQSDVLGLLRDGALLGQAQIMSRRIGPLRLAWLPRGPVWAAEIPDALKAQGLRLLADHGPAGRWQIATHDERLDAPLPLGCRLMTPQHVAELDLTASEAARLAAQHGKWRNRLRRAQEGPLKIEARPLDPKRDAHLLALEEAQRRARGYRAVPRHFLVQWARQHPSQSRIFIARAGANCVAFMLFLLHAPTATYQAGWTCELGRRHSAHTLLLWQAANWLAARGYRRLDLGLVDTETAPGLARFKIGSGARIRPLGATLLHLPRPPRLSLPRFGRAA